MDGLLGSSLNFRRRVEIGWKPTPHPLLLLLRLRLNELATGWLRESLIEIYQRAPNLIRRVCSWRGYRRGGGAFVLVDNCCRRLLFPWGNDGK